MAGEEQGRGTPLEAAPGPVPAPPAGVTFTAPADAQTPVAVDGAVADEAPAAAATPVAPAAPLTAGAAAAAAPAAQPSHTASPLAGEGYVGAIDLGGTKILAAIVGPDGKIVSRTKKVTGSDHRPAVVIDRIATCLREAARLAGVEAQDLQAVGMGAPGPIDPVDGSIKIAPNLSWENVPLRAELLARLRVPVALGNDVRVAVLAEHAAGAGRGVRHMVGIWPGTGIGGGLIVDGQLYLGSGMMAGEIGHITLKAKGPRCGCGGRGHLEALASRTAIVRDVAKAVKKGDKTLLTKLVGKDVSKATSGALAEAWHQGDRVVSRVLARAAEYLALGIASMANVLNPELVILGGGVIEGLGEPYIEIVRRHVREMPLLSSPAALRIVKSERGDDAGITGAALLARRGGMRV
ncbi:MAG TPA: ROK family protein [Chloroflexota bacterium]|nr:ROK family protein [Chloroflexota bacterium]